MRRLILLTVLALGPTAASAENGLLYLGAGLTNSSLTVSSAFDFEDDAPTVLNNHSWKAFAGVRPLKWLAAEADYIDLGNGNSNQTTTATFTTWQSHASAWAGYAVGFIPLRVVDFYGKLGAARWKLKTSYVVSENFTLPPSTMTAVDSFSNTEFAWGIGAQAYFSVVGVRLEYEGFKVHSGDANVGSLSLFLNF